MSKLRIVSIDKEIYMVDLYNILISSKIIFFQRIHRWVTFPNFEMEIHMCKKTNFIWAITWLCDILLGNDNKNRWKLL